MVKRPRVPSSLLALAALAVALVLGLLHPAGHGWGPLPPAVASAAAPAAPQPGPQAASRLERAEPAAQQWVPERPEAVRLTFSEPVDLDGSSIQLQSYRRPTYPGRLGQPEPHVLVFTPDPPLEEATYEVVWRARFRSGSTEEGRFSFTYLAPQEGWDGPLDRRDVNRHLGNLVPGWLFILPAAIGVGGLVWVFWTLGKK